MPDATWLVRVEPGCKLRLAYSQVSAHDGCSVLPSSRAYVCVVYVCVCVPSFQGLIHRMDSEYYYFSEY